MKQLLSGFNSEPSNPSSASCNKSSSLSEIDAPAVTQPVQQLPHDSPVVDTSLTAEDIDLDALLEGAEDWDWDNDISSPPRKKPVMPAKPQVIPTLFSYDSKLIL